VKGHVGVAGQPRVDVVTGMGGQVVHEDVQLPFGGVGGDHPVHEGEELDRTASREAVGVDVSGVDFRGGE
jgi:hypothetical protein